jgi:hypothetical protein
MLRRHTLAAVTEPNPPNAAAQDKEYVSAMLDWIAADVGQVYIRITAAAGLIALYIGLGCLGVAAILYFAYVNKTL